MIIGAGPAGLFCAHELIKKGFHPIIIEKENFVGGLAATHRSEFGSFEIGPHIFHTDDEYIFNIAKQYLGDDLMLMDWKVAQYLGGELLEFPNSVRDMIQKKGMWNMLLFILSYLRSQFIRTDDFKSFVYRKVGKRLAEFNVINYTEKMWGIPLEELETEWIKPRLDRLSIWKILKTIFSSHKRQFHYPRLGAGQLYEKMSEDMDVRYQEWPISIEVLTDEKIQVQTNRQTYLIDALVSSAPLVDIVSIIRDIDHNLLSSLSALRHRSQIYVILTYDTADIIDHQWIYFPEPEIPFCRVHSAGAFSTAHTPQNTSLLVFEYFCFNTDDIWQLSDEEIIQLTTSSFHKSKVITQGEIIDAHVMRKGKAYPLMSKGRTDTLSIIQSLRLVDRGIHAIGRHGLHTYDNQHDAARTGVDICKSVQYR